MHTRLIGITLLLAVAAGAPVAAEEGADAKIVSGMSILGNNEAPKSLYIVPWKSAEIGSETTLTSSLLNEELAPVDKPVFMRELDFYRISHADQ